MQLTRGAEEAMRIVKDPRLIAEQRRMRKIARAIRTIGKNTLLKDIAKRFRVNPAAVSHVAKRMREGKL